MGAFAEAARARCAEEGYGLLHANFWMSGLVAAEVRRALGVPFVVTFHALGRVRRLHQGEADGFPDERFAIEERVAREAALVIAECPQDRDDLVTLYDADPARIRMAPCGVDPAELAPVGREAARDLLGIPRGAFVALQLGRMVPRKGVDTAIEAFARFRARTGAEALLLVVGGESDAPDPALTPELGRLGRVAREAGVQDAVRFTGRRHRDVLRYHYAAADVFVTLPWYEPFGITPLEAMACGTPVLGSAVGGLLHTVADGETGLLVPPRDPDAAADALERLHRDPQARAAMGRAGRERVLGRFTWAEVARQVEGIYDEALAARPAPAPLPGAEVRRGFDELIDVLGASRDALTPGVLRAAEEVGRCFARGGTLLVAGNGGSAAEAQHLAAELVGRFLLDGRRALPAIALCADTATVTAWSNDYGFEHAFARQVEAYGRPGDVLLAFSTSGRSPNLLRAFEAAGRRGMRRLALLGRDGGALREMADLALVVPSWSTPRIQEAHAFLLHQICERVEVAIQAAAPGPRVVDGTARGALEAPPVPSLEFTDGAGRKASGSPLAAAREPARPR